MADVTIIDYGVGNLLSVSRAFTYMGAQVELTSSLEKVVNARRLVLPGVGAFADAMAELRARELIEPVKGFARSNRPFLGICLGMQMMLDESEEFGRHKGLGLIAGRVAAIPREGVGGSTHKVPHIGWSELLSTGVAWDRSILEGVEEYTPMYFVHSFTAHPQNPSHRLADCDYGGIKLSAVIQSGNVYGCQFHPEKSGVLGLKIIRNFLNL